MRSSARVRVRVFGILPFMILLAGLTEIPRCHAATWLVRPDGTGDVPTIRAAIQAAASGDTIALADGVFRGAGNHGVTMRDKPLTLRSLSGDPEACIVDAGGDGRCLLIGEGQGPETVVADITFRNGHEELPIGGGGVSCRDGSAPTIRNCIFTANYAYQGGGLGVGRGAAATVVSCLFTANRSADFGAGLGPDETGGGSVLCIGCRFEDNLSHLHGGGAAVSAPSRFEDCLFLRNRVENGSGGGFQNCGPGWTVLERCTFYRNSALAGGGAIT